VRGPQVDSLTTGIGRDKDLELTGQEVLLHPVTVTLVDGVLQRLGGVSGSGEETSELVSSCRAESDAAMS
jgi:hypothetical protein